MRPELHFFCMPHRLSYVNFQRVKHELFSFSISLRFFVGGGAVWGRAPREPSHIDGSFEYPQHMFWLRNKTYNFQLRNLILKANIASLGKHTFAP